MTKKLPSLILGWLLPQYVYPVEYVQGVDVSDDGVCWIKAHWHEDVLNIDGVNYEN